MPKKGGSKRRGGGRPSGGRARSRSPVPQRRVAVGLHHMPSSFALQPQTYRGMHRGVVHRMVGVKGSDVLDSTGDPRVDLNVQLVRSQTEEVIANGMEKILALKTDEAEEDAFVMAFHTRNVRGGKGERDVSKHMFSFLHKECPALMADLLDLVPHYGSWKDLFQLADEKHVNPSIRARVISLAATQLKKDLAVEEGPGQTLSLCAKWAPRPGKSLPCVLNQLAKTLFPSVTPLSSRLKQYRKLVAGLNRRLNTVEVKMCEKAFDKIDPKAVPGRAGKKYVKAFLNLKADTMSATGEALRHPDDKERMECRAHFQEHYAKAAKGEAKVHGAETVFPHELVKKVMTSPEMGEDEKNHIRGVWKGMVEKAAKGGGLGRSLAMCDFSGSMQSSGENGASPYLVSLALGMLISEVTTEEFKDVIMTFDSNPILHKFPPGSDMFTKMSTIASSGVGQGLSTDFQAAMDLILTRLKERRCRPGQEPDNLIVLTDMNWDAACSQNQQNRFTGNHYQNVVKASDGWETHVDMIRDAFKRAGEELWGVGQGWTMPTIVIWNLAASSRDFHAAADTEGVGFLSGWSPALFNVLQDKGMDEAKGVSGPTPYEMLRIELDNEQYALVRERVRSFRKKNSGDDASAASVVPAAAVASAASAVPALAAAASAVPAAAAAGGGVSGGGAAAEEAEMKN